MRSLIVTVGLSAALALALSQHNKIDVPTALPIDQRPLRNSRRA